MNNRQVAVLAAAMRTGGRTQNSVQDMLEDSTVIEQYLDARDTEASEAAALAEVRVAVRYEEA